MKPGHLLVGGYGTPIHGCSLSSYFSLGSSFSPDYKHETAEHYCYDNKAEAHNDPLMKEVHEEGVYDKDTHTVTFHRTSQKTFTDCFSNADVKFKYIPPSRVGKEYPPGPMVGPSLTHSEDKYAVVPHNDRVRHTLGFFKKIKKGKNKPQQMHIHVHTLAHQQRTRRPGLYTHLRTYILTRPLVGVKKTVKKVTKVVKKVKKKVKKVVKTVKDVAKTAVKVVKTVGQVAVNVIKGKGLFNLDLKKRISWDIFNFNYDKKNKYVTVFCFCL